MNPIWCNLCNERAHFGVNRVKNFILFHFCTSCTRQRREECDQFMLDHAPDLPMKVTDQQKSAGARTVGPRRPGRDVMPPRVGPGALSPWELAGGRP